MLGYLILTVLLLCNLVASQNTYFTRAFFDTPDCGASSNTFIAVTSIVTGYCLGETSSAYQCIGPHSGPSEYNVWRTVYPTDMLGKCTLDANEVSKTSQIISTNMSKNACHELDLTKPEHKALTSIPEISSWSVDIMSKKLYMKFECSNSIFGSFSSLVLNNTATAIVNVYTQYGNIQCPYNRGGLYIHTALNGSTVFVNPRPTNSRYPSRVLTCLPDRTKTKLVMQHVACGGYTNDTCRYGIGDAYSLTPDPDCEGGFGYYCNEIPPQSQLGLVNVTLPISACYPDFCAAAGIDDDCLPTAFTYTNDTSLLPGSTSTVRLVAYQCGQSCSYNQQTGSMTCDNYDGMGCAAVANYTLGLDFGFKVPDLPGVLRIHSANKTACYYYKFTIRDGSSFSGKPTERVTELCQQDCWSISSAFSQSPTGTYNSYSYSSGTGGSSSKSGYKFDVINPTGTATGGNSNGGNSNGGNSNSGTSNPGSSNTGTNGVSENNGNNANKIAVCTIILCILAAVF